MKAETLSTSESLALDVIRVLASMMVAFGHLTQPYFSTGWRDCTIYAQACVGVFFILSGFVIRYVTCRRPSTIGHYLADRGSRIYSVAIPTLLFTVVADQILRSARPDFYWPQWSNHGTSRVFALAMNLVFCGQLWGRRVEALLNLPYWSINYEVIYYIGYGCYFYLRGWSRWISVALVAIIAGPFVVGLFPLWALGCVLHDAYKNWCKRGTELRNAARLLWIPALAAVAVWLIPGHVSAIDKPFSFHNHHHLKLPLPNSTVLFGFIWAVFFINILALARRFHVTSRSRTDRIVRFIAEGTFPIYLLHFPLFLVVAALIPYNHSHVFPKLMMFLASVVLGILAGPFCNLLKLKLRSLYPSPKTQAAAR
jgi:peptidoglycan/LPS O-acetylase OafA/YrhL